MSTTTTARIAAIATRTGADHAALHDLLRCDRCGSHAVAAAGDGAGFELSHATGCDADDDHRGLRTVRQDGAILRVRHHRSNRQEVRHAR
jgi:hypothetical protein